MIPEKRPTARETGINQGSRIGNERTRPPRRYCTVVEIKKRPTITLSQTAAGWPKIQLQMIAPQIAPGRYQRTTGHSISLHETRIRVGLAIRLAILMTGAIVFTRMEGGTAAASNIL